MKDLGRAKKILEMRISRDKERRLLKLLQADDIEKVLRRFNMVDVKPVNVPLGGHFKLSKAQEPKTEDEKAFMSKVLYVSVVGSLMYALVYTKPDIAQAVGVANRYMCNLEQE